MFQIQKWQRHVPHGAQERFARGVSQEIRDLVLLHVLRKGTPDLKFLAALLWRTFPGNPTSETAKAPTESPTKCTNRQDTSRTFFRPSSGSCWRQNRKRVKCSGMCRCNQLGKLIAPPRTTCQSISLVFDSAASSDPNSVLTLTLNLDPNP